MSFFSLVVTILLVLFCISNVFGVSLLLLVVVFLILLLSQSPSFFLFSFYSLSVAFFYVLYLKLFFIHLESSKHVLQVRLHSSRIFFLLIFDSCSLLFLSVLLSSLSRFLNKYYKICFISCRIFQTIFLF